MGHSSTKSGGKEFCGYESAKFLTLFVQDGSYSLPKLSFAVYKWQAVKLTFFAPSVMSTVGQLFKEDRRH